MAERSGLAVIGAGIMGSAVAYHLTVRGVARVVVVDTAGSPNLPPATRQSAGVLAYPGWDAWDLALLRDTAREYRSIADRTGQGRLAIHGGLRLARSEEGARWLRRAETVLRREGVEVERLTSPRIADLLPAGAPDDLVGGLYTPEDLVFSAPEIADAYLRAAVREGAELRLETAPARVRRSDGGWRIDLALGSIQCARVVLAAGAWVRAPLEEVGVPLPLAPFRTQAGSFRPAPLVGPFPTVHDVDLNLYLRPDGRGRVLAGDGTERRSIEPGLASARADPSFVEGTRREVHGWLPDLASIEPEQAWAGLCVATPDRYPVVGAVPGAEGLFVAAGFNGFGAMRAGGLASRLADGIRFDRWEALAPADPRRFESRPPEFDPQPELPLEAPGTDNDDRPSGPSPLPPPSPPGELGDLELCPVRGAAELEIPALLPLSDWFGPFLRHFGERALAIGAAVELALDSGDPVGLFVASPSEGIDSVFTRTRRVAEAYLARENRRGLYLETAGFDRGEPIDLMAADLRDWEPRGPLRNPVRIGGAADLSALQELMRELSGSDDEAWFATLPRPDETAFVCEIDGRLVGVSWLTRVGRHARGHSFMVSPRFRGLGIGTDLLEARMRWLKQTGAVDVVSEIYTGNAASRAADLRIGMAPVGRWYLYPAPTFAERRSSDSSSRSNR